MKRTHFQLLLPVFLIGGILVNCVEKTPSPRQQGLDLQETGLQGTPYFSPQQGEVWRYRVEKEVPLGTTLSPVDASRYIESSDTAQLVTFVQTRHCKGERKFSDFPHMLTAIAISEDGKQLGEELYHIRPDEILSWGWVPAPLRAEEAQLLNEGVPLARAKMRPGQSWQAKGRGSENSFLFKVIEQGELTVPAGTFQATRIQITSERISRQPVTGEEHTTYLKRSLWLAQDVGILREETIYYDDRKVRVKQRSELIEWVLPSAGTSSEPVPVRLNN